MNVAQNRKIKADRVYRTLGKMSWQRIIAGIALLLFVVYLSGTLSEIALNRGAYTRARDMILFRDFLEKNRPDFYLLVKAAGDLEDGEADQAAQEILQIDPLGLRRTTAETYRTLCSRLAETLRDEPELAQQLEACAAFDYQAALDEAAGK